jgi:hypothetical protein
MPLPSLKNLKGTSKKQVTASYLQKIKIFMSNIWFL